MLHNNLALGDRHAAHNWEYADATARTSATGFASGDVGKLALQTDDNSLWVLTSTTPTWVAPINTAGFQIALVSGTNIKTVGGASLLGSGDVPIVMPPVNYVDKGNSGTTTQTLDYSAGQLQRIVATGAHTINCSNWPASGKLGEMLLELVNGGSVAITFAFGTTMNWVKSDGSYVATYASSGVTLQSSGTDWIYLWTRDGGATVNVKVVR